MLDSLTKAAKGFFIEDDGAATPATPSVPVVLAPAAQPLPGVPASQQPEQRHLDHIAGLMLGDGKDFGAYTKMVNSMADSGLSGAQLYQTAFRAFAAVTGTDLPTLLSSAESLSEKLATDRAKVQQRHREKLGESANPSGPPGALALLVQQQAQLETAVADLTRQLAERTQQLQAAQQHLATERQKVQSALSSYELAHAAAVAELQAHRQATQSFLAPTPTH